MRGMTSTDYIIDALLILTIFRQLRERRFDLHSLLLPVGLLAFACAHYMTAVPTAGNDVALYVLLGGAGAVLGAICGLSARMRVHDDGHVLARAGRITVIAWVLGMGSRLAFGVYANGSGAHEIAHFSIAHSITGAAAWTTALLLMAVAQVLAKLGVQLVRGRALMQRVPAPAVA
jgi:hypothetical protein